MGWGPGPWDPKAEGFPPERWSSVMDNIKPTYRFDFQGNV